MTDQTQYQILQDLPTDQWTTGDVFALNDDEYISLPRSIGSYFIKYSVSKNIWSGPYILNDIAGDTFVDDATVDQESRSLIVLTGASRVHAIDTERMIRKSESTIDVMSGCRPRMLVIGDHIHCIGTDVHRDHGHYIFHKLTRNLVTGPNPIHEELHWVHKLMFLSSRNSLVAFGETQDQMAMICEYSLDTQRWSVWDWVQTPGTYWPALVCTHCGRYVLCCGGRHWGESRGFDHEWKGQIMVYDVDEQQHVESALECPVGSRYHAVMMRSERRDEVLTFGFMRKWAQRFLPRHLVKLISKWVCYEFVHLIADEYWSGKKGHWKINVDDILESV